MKKYLLMMVALLFCLLAAGIQGGIAQAQDKMFTNGIGMEFVLIPAGQFTRSWVTENQFGEDVPHQQVVTISKPFYLGKYEVTQEQWVAVMGSGSNPSQNKGRTNPVESVSWDDVQVFIQKLNKKEGGRKYRLPTEAEWEYAARAGTETEWFFGDNPAALGQYAWFSQNSGESPHQVGAKKPNPWDLYDIYGNVGEWVADRLGDYQAGAVTDPAGPAKGSDRVFRGGSRGSNIESCQSAFRSGGAPGDSGDLLGFRLAFSPGQ
jgi:formylglycine-generating enzyme required for sulfatase activity